MVWKKLSIFLPSMARCWDFSVAVYGGRKNLTEAYVINPIEGTTDALGDDHLLPGLGRVYHTIEVLNNVTYLIGGQEPTGNQTGMEPTDLVFSKTAKNSPWELLPNSKMSFPRARMASTIFNGRIWACGGRGGAAFESLTVCESFNGTHWFREASLFGGIGVPASQQGRDRFTISTTSEGMIAIGGHNSFLGEPQKSTEIYQGGEWSPGPTLPEARYGHQTVVYKDAVFVFGGLVENRAAILKLDNFQSYWSPVGRMVNPVRLKFNAILKGPEVFIYGGKCERIGKRKFRKQETYDVCDPQVEIFSLASYRSKAVDFDFPGNSDAQAILFEKIEATVVEEKPQPAAVVDVLADTNGELDNNKTRNTLGNGDEDEEMKSDDQKDSEPVELLLDFVEQKDNRKDGELEEIEEFEEIQVFPSYSEEEYESEEYEISIPSLLPSFSLPKGNLQDLLSIRKRPNLPFLFEEQPVEEEDERKTEVSEVEKSEFSGVRNFQTRTSGGTGISCRSCNSADPSTCASSFTTCARGEVCYLRVEMYDRVTTRISAGCAASDACETQKAQNFRFNLPQTLSRLNQCRPLTPYVASVCRQCCATANCNSNIPSDLNGWL